MAPDRILIAGGGIGGLATALALAQKGIASQVLEKASRLGEIGAGIQLGPNAFHCFDRLGVGEAARGMAVYIDQLRLMDALADGEICHIDLGDRFRARFGNPYAVVHRGDLHAGLFETVSPARIAYEKKLAGIERAGAGVTLTFADGTRAQADGVIGADGVHSRVREILLGEERPDRRGIVAADDLRFDAEAVHRVERASNLASQPVPEQHQSERLKVVRGALDGKPEGDSANTTPRRPLVAAAS